MPSDVRTGSRLGEYQLGALLGAGATGAVYLAEDTRTRDHVALKVLEPELAQDERFRQRFLRESRLAASLDHPNVVRVIEAGEADGLLYLAMAYVEGSDLRDVLRAERRLEPDRAFALLSQVAGALDAAHEAGLVHRDVKPGNILMTSTSSGEVSYVCDFGLARHLSSVTSLTAERGLIGTIDYIPPEQIEGAEIDGRADVYSLGCVLFECLAGERPFDRESELSVVFAHLNEPPPRLSALRPDLSPAYDDLFATALAKSPDSRPATCGELIAAARGAHKGHLPARSRRRRRRLAFVLAALVVAAVATAGLVASLRSSPSEPAAITETAIAGARLGQQRAAYEKLFGDGLLVNQQDETNGSPGTGFATVAFENAKVWVFFPDGIEGTASMITTWNQDYKTAKGIGPCSTIDELKAAYGSDVKPDYYGTVRTKHFMWDVGTNLLFSATGPPALGPNPSSYVPAVGLFDGTVPDADADGGPRAFAGFVTGNETPRCVP